MSQLADLIKSTVLYLKESPYPFVLREQDVAEITFFFPLKPLNKTVEMREFVFISDKDIRVIGVVPFSVPEESRELAAEYLMRVNQYLQTGWFSMDYDDGEVRASAERTQIVGVPSKEDFNFLVMTPISLISRFAAGLLLTIKRMGTPKENADKYTPDVLK